MEHASLPIYVVVFLAACCIASLAIVIYGAIKFRK